MQLLPPKNFELEVLSNQVLLVSEYLDRVAQFEGMVVFDGHAIIDAASGMVEVPTKVFASISIASMIFVKDRPEMIHSHRLADTNRARPPRTAPELAAHQALPLAKARNIADIPGIDLNSVQPGDLATFIDHLKAMQLHFSNSFHSQ